MARIINELRIVNAKLISKNVNFFGKRWAVQDGADGYSTIDVVVTDTTQDVKLYLEGSNDITVFPVASDVSKLCKSALTSFPKINTIFLFSATKVNIEEQTEGLGDYLSYLSLLSKIYVPSALLDDYQSDYASLSSKFDIIVEDLTITIEWVGNNTLTSEEITRQLNTLEPAYLNQATKLVIDDRYTDYLDTLWAYNFTEKCSSLNNNLWYGTSKVDLTQRTLTGVDELLESDIDNFVASISDDKKSGVTQLHFEGFSDMSVALEYDYEDLPNLEYVWLDNVRWEKTTEINGYKICKYIESSGSQKINTGLNTYGGAGYFTREWKIEMDTEFTRTDVNQNIGGATSNNGGGIGFGIYNGHFSLVASSGLEYNIDGEADTNRHIFIANRIGTNKLIIDGQEKTLTNTYFSSGEGYTIYLFCTTLSTVGGIGNYTYQKMYYSKIYDKTNTLVRNYIPVYNKISGTIGLYDLVNNQFYQNSGSGNFTKGNDSYVFAGETYFYPLSNLEQEYDAHLNQTFYLDYNGTLPSYPNYQLTYYTDINCTISILPENMQSGTRYYAKAVMVTLTIQGSGTLTSAIVESQIARAGSAITKVVIPDTYTLNTSASYHCLDSVDTYLPNVDTLEMNSAILRQGNNGTADLYSNWANDNNKFKNVIHNYSSLPSQAFQGTKIEYYENNIISTQYIGSNNFSFSTIKDISMANLQSVSYRMFSYSGDFGKYNDILFEEVRTLDANSLERTGLTRLFLPKVNNSGVALNDNSNYKLFISTSNCVLTNYFGGSIERYLPKGLYVKATDLSHYMVENYWSGYGGIGRLFGVIDNGDVYANIKNRNVSMGYPKLNGIDTEANIQLLTPSDNALYLASDTGNLWQYVSGTWTNLFGTDYSATWYSNEDCTTTVLPSAMDTTHTYYVKLTWNNPTLTIEPKSGETTLTSAIVTREIAKASSNPSVVTKVIVPVDFTSYDSGSITAIQNGGLTNLRYLETTYSGGAMELDLQGDIVAKITSIGKTLDEALVYARYIDTTANPSYKNNADLIIMPPKTLSPSLELFAYCSNLVYIYKLTINSGNSMQDFGRDSSNLIRIDETTIGKMISKYFDWSIRYLYLDITFDDFNESLSIGQYLNGGATKLVLNGIKTDLTFNYASSANLTHDVLMGLINSLGTPTSQKTLNTMGRYSQLLSAEEIAIATAKNWVLQ